MNSYTVTPSPAFMQALTDMRKLDAERGTDEAGSLLKSFKVGDDCTRNALNILTLAYKTLSHDDFTKLVDTTKSRWSNEQEAIK